MGYTKTNWQDLPNTATPITATRLNNMEKGIADANGAIGISDYSSSSTYIIGDLCIYNNKLYRCKTAISTSEVWNATHWEEKTLLNIREDYSTNEMIIGTWLDGSAIYRKVIACNLGTLSSSWKNLVALPTGFKQLVNIRGVRYNSNTSIYFPIYITSSWYVQFGFDANNIRIQGAGYDDMDIYLILDYTKN